MVFHVVLRRMGQHDAGFDFADDASQRSPAFLRLSLDQRRQWRGQPQFVTAREADALRAVIDAQTTHGR